MRQIQRTIWSILFFGVILGSLIAGAAPVWDKPYTLRQPDNTFVEVRIWGDEFYQVVESPDGYTLVRDPATQIICYATLSADGNELISTGVRVGAKGAAKLGLAPHLRINQDAVRKQAREARAGSQARAASILAKVQPKAGPPNHGAVRGICLIIDFPDQVWLIPPAEVDALLNQPGYSNNGNHGSVRDYYYDVSNGIFDYTNYVPTQYYRAQHNEAYYDNPAEDNGPKAVELMTEALNQMETDGFDFSQYDANGDGLVDGLNCFYAGQCQSGWAKGLWPHSSVMLFEADGVKVVHYQITDMGTTLYIGTFCHENGHMICWWPDLYDYDYDSRGIGKWCLMASGNYPENAPVQPCAYLKDLAGWTNTSVLTGAPRTGLSAPAAGNVVYKYVNPANARECYMVENRQQSGRDVSIPGSGLAIWHTDEMGSNNLNEMTPARHFEVTLVQADGYWHLEHNVNNGDANDVWQAPTYTVCGPDTIPNTNWWAGNMSYIRVANISASAPTMTFDFVAAGSPNQDTDGDGISDWDEIRDLDPVTPGIQNPFDPNDPDVTGDNFSNNPDGIPDGDNDYDGDGISNKEEFRLGGNPLDPHSGMPVASTAGLAALALGIALLGERTMRRSARTH